MTRNDDDGDDWARKYKFVQVKIIFINIVLRGMFRRTADGDRRL